MSALLLMLAAVLLLIAMHKLILLFFLPRRQARVKTMAPSLPVTQLETSPRISISRLITRAILSGFTSLSKSSPVSLGKRHRPKPGATDLGQSQTHDDANFEQTCSHEATPRELLTQETNAFQNKIIVPSFSSVEAAVFLPPGEPFFSQESRKPKDAVDADGGFSEREF